MGLSKDAHLLLQHLTRPETANHSRCHLSADGQASSAPQCMAQSELECAVRHITTHSRNHCSADLTMLRSAAWQPANLPSCCPQGRQRQGQQCRLLVAFAEHGEPVTTSQRQRSAFRHGDPNCRCASSTASACHSAAHFESNKCVVLPTT